MKGPSARHDLSLQITLASVKFTDEMLTLGIETSCDETAVAVVEDGVKALTNVVLSQTQHSRFGGVVPEIASRAHVAAISPLYEEALESAGVTLADCDLVAVTRGP
ncbi:MAG: hypothetical protein ACE5GA_03760, partial [Candidatus Zixiibacteriota bacterium]